MHKAVGVWESIRVGAACFFHVLLLRNFTFIPAPTSPPTPPRPTSRPTAAPPRPTVAPRRQRAAAVQPPLGAGAGRGVAQQLHVCHLLPGPHHRGVPRGRRAPHQSVAGARCAVCVRVCVSGCCVNGRGMQGNPSPPQRPPPSDAPHSHTLENNQPPPAHPSTPRPAGPRGRDQLHPVGPRRPAAGLLLR